MKTIGEILGRFDLETDSCRSPYSLLYYIHSLLATCSLTHAIFSKDLRLEALDEIEYNFLVLKEEKVQRYLWGKVRGLSGCS